MSDKTGRVGVYPRTGSNSFWNQYKETLLGKNGKKPYSESSISQIDYETKKIIEKIVLPGKIKNIEDFFGKSSNGCVVGHVQSGKTSAMIGLAAKAFDSGFKLVVVLAGLKNDLREQTAYRFVTELAWMAQRDVKSRKIRYPRRCKSPGYKGHIKGPWVVHFQDDLIDCGGVVTNVQEEFEKESAFLLIVKKESKNLNKLKELFKALSKKDKIGRCPIMIIDDECDEASAPGGDDAKIPEFFKRLIQETKQYISYVGFSATLAATVFQDRKNVFFPNNFIETMKYPSHSDTLFSYENDFIYTGPDFFYDWLERNGQKNWLVKPVLEEGEDAFENRKQLSEALISYFVSAGMRRSTSEGKLFPHTMMVHDNHKLENHKDNACFVVKVLRENAGEEAVEDYELHQYLHEDPHKRIKASWVKDWISRDEGRWISCYEDFKKRSRDIVDLTKNLKGARKEKDYPEWGRVKEEILKILPELKLRVLNSEDGGERSLDFVPIFDGDNESIYDSLSIVVGGNKLSRGLTIEGLCISYYTRAPREFNSDTNIQRERWFGYRFEYIEFCRIFTSPGIYAKLKRSHVGLLDQMTQFIELNKKGIKPSRINFLFVESGDTYSTAKRGQSERKVIWFKDFFLRHVEVKNREIAKQNLNLFKDLKNNHAFENIYTQGKKNIRGIKTKKPISALALADFIEKLQFSEHNPKPGSGIKSMLTEYYKKPFTGRKCFENKFERFEGRGDPYDVAAYLRLWDALWHERNKRATYDYDLQSIHTEKWDPVEAPEFNIVFRHGSGSTSSSESKLPLTRKMIEVDGKVSFPWGARGYGQSFEDRNIDLNSPGDIRTKGLFIVWISSGAEGEYSLYRPIFGIVFPEGGPVAITRGQKWK